ncbi:DUF1631 domain-containing protein [Xanthomonas sp. A2111]|uniref:DUF1631 family protein n=1 Tax=Xanthomonas hawaiiensis TaxID=3003247 RepID=A0ABU2I3Y3_9XANT|nr:MULTISPECIES: DUF1631 family protein [unclassified Xanthomonas]MBO9830120.1 DUF1631 domain-containing protein [Xanthomonas sp. A2111]MBO9873621.1 DUF1631 domain-containing protein [Xanthomonas sp. D-93]MDS9992363.1 DUF1631 family protein [Xanthomonas sp. A2111]WNH44151.1 DUF1631 family protein [Xanthomonas sp. A6251]
MTLAEYAEELSPSRNADLLEQVRDVVSVPLAGAFGEVLDVLAEALFRMAERAGPAQNDYFEAIQLLRQQREPIAARFRAHLAQAWQAVEAGRPLSVERSLARERGDLSLVSEQELDVRLAVRNLAGAIQHRWRPELMRLNRFLGFIAGGQRIDADNNPFGPEHVGAAVYAALHGLVLAPQVQLAIVKICEQELQERVGELYAQLEQRLNEVARARALPSGRPRRRAIPRLGASEDEAAPDWISRFFENWDTAAPLSAAQRRAARALDAHARNEQEVLPPALRALLHEAQPEAGPGDGRRCLSPRELLSVLSLLQTMPLAGFAAVCEHGGPLAQGLRRQIAGIGASLGLDPASTCLDPADADTLDLVGLLFDVMLEECVLQPAQRELLGQMLVPMAKVALIDGRLFVRDGHPARRLLNLLADACDGNAGSTGPEQALLAQAQAAVERVVRDFDEHLAVFLALEAEFGSAYEQYRRRVEIAERRAAELQRAEERREVARQRAAQALHDLLQQAGDDLTLPLPIEAFLRQSWCQYVQQSALRDDGQGNALAAALALGDAVLAQCRQAQSGATPAEGWLQPQHAELTRLWTSVGLDAAAAEAAWQALHTALDDLAHARPLQAALPAMGVDVPEPPAAETVPALPEPAQATDFDHITADYFRTLPLGTWLDFVDREGRVQPGKLTWVSPISARLLFVNRRGGRLCVASAEALAVMARLDRLRLHRDDDAFYSAMQGVVDRLERVAVAA